MYESSAVISECQRYRYELRRIWQPKTGLVCFVMLNPSTADANKDDPTIRRCMGFAATWGFGGIIIGNLFAYRTPKPFELRTVPDPIGPLNNQYLLSMSREALFTVCAWGNHGTLIDRDKAVYPLLQFPKCLAVNQRGTPKHPLYSESYLTPIDFDMLIRPGELSCGYECHTDERYGFIPEAGCPEHDFERRKNDE